MRKYMPILVMILVFSLATVVSASDVNDTVDLTDSTTISQDDTTTTESNIATSKIEKKEKNTDIKEKTEITEESDDCCSAIIQGYANDSTISFRRDSTSPVTLNVTHNSTYIKQTKGSGSYFFHVLISANGWIVGNGGTDAPETNIGIENAAKSIIENNNLTTTSFKKIINLKKNSARGHTVIKAPNGTYSLFIIHNGKTYTESGTLQPGQFLSVPNNPIYFVKGKYQNYTNSKYFIESSKLIAAKDMYGVERRNIMTYYYKRTNLTSNIKVYASNDDGRYVNRDTKKYVDSVQTNNRFISTSQIPTLEGWAPIDDVNFTIKIRTNIKSANVNTKTNKVSLKATVKDEFGNLVNGGLVSLIANGNTVKYKNGSVVYTTVKNGAASISYTIPNIWKANNYSYYFRYYGNSKYSPVLGNTAKINVKNVATMTVSYPKVVAYGENLTIVTKVTYTSNKTKVNGGQVIYKINGKTIKNSDGSTHTVNVKNGVARFTFKFNKNYAAKNYTLTVVYANGAQRNEKVSNVTLTKITTKIIAPKVSVNKKVMTVTGRVTDKNYTNIKSDTRVSLKIDGKTVEDANGTVMTFTVKKGVINFKFNLTQNLKKGNHTVTLVVPELQETLGKKRTITIKI